MHWTGLEPGEARRRLAEKDKSKRDKRMSLSDAVERFVHDGDDVGIGGFVNGRQPVAIIHEIARQGRKGLTLSFQSGGLAPEYLAGAMLLEPTRTGIKRMELAYWAHEAFGLSPLFRHVAERGLVELEDWSNYNMSARFKAASMGLPFLPTRSPIGSDMLRANRAAMIDCPFTGRPIMLVPACHPNVALIHVQEADPFGNCRIQGQLFTCPEIALAAAHTIVTCERVVEHEEMTRYPNRVSIPFFAVDAVVEVPFGAYPGNCYGYYYFDETHIPQFLGAASKFRQGDPGPLREYYDTYVFGVTDTAAFIDLIPQRQIQHVQRAESGLRAEGGYPATGGPGEGVARR